MVMFRIGSGGFSTNGVTTANITRGENITSVQCLSNHTTSFAVLVDVAGGLEVSNLLIKVLHYNSYQLQKKKKISGTFSHTLLDI